MAQILMKFNMNFSPWRLLILALLTSYKEQIAEIITKTVNLAVHNSINNFIRVVWNNYVN
jgi:hypothetical protein